MWKQRVCALPGVFDHCCRTHQQLAKLILTRNNILVHYNLRRLEDWALAEQTASWELDKGRKCCRNNGFGLVKNIHRDDYDAPPGAQHARLSCDLTLEQGAQIVNRQVNRGGRVFGFKSCHNGEGGGSVGERGHDTAVRDAVIASHLIAQIEMKSGLASCQ